MWWWVGFSVLLLLTTSAPLLVTLDCISHVGLAPNHSKAQKLSAWIDISWLSSGAGRY